MTRLEPLSLDQVEGLEEVEQTYQRTLGFVPNGLRIMARRPEIVRGFIALRRAVLDPASGTVPAELKNLVAHIASRTHGCMYCQAHALQGAGRAGAEQARLEAIWEYQSSELFSEAERAALDFAVHAAAVPNLVTDADFIRLRQHWTKARSSRSWPPCRSTASSTAGTTRSPRPWRKARLRSPRRPSVTRAGPAASTSSGQHAQ